jgi:hypothetical protein
MTFVIPGNLHFYPLSFICLNISIMLVLNFFHFYSTCSPVTTGNSMPSYSKHHNEDHLLVDNFSTLPISKMVLSKAAHMESFLSWPLYIIKCSNNKKWPKRQCVRGRTSFHHKVKNTVKTLLSWTWWEKSLSSSRLRFSAFIFRGLKIWEECPLSKLNTPDDDDDKAHFFKTSETDYPKSYPRSMKSSHYCYKYDVISMV